MESVRFSEMILRNAGGKKYKKTDSWEQNHLFLMTVIYPSYLKDRHQKMMDLKQKRGS